MLSYEKYRRQMIDTSITLVPLLVMAWYYYGPRVLVMAGIAVLSAVLADYICLRFQGERWWKKYDFSAFITGLTYVLLLPASAPYWLVVFGAVFAIVVVRHPFGGHYNTLFNPAMTAFAFVVICWNGLVTKYPAVLTKLPLTPTADVPTYNSPSYRLMLGGANNIDLLDALLGDFIGPMGTTAVAVLLCCGLYLAVRRTIIWQIPVAALTIVGLNAWYFPRMNASREISLLMELSSGVLLFSVIFVAAMDNDEIHTIAGKWTYGIILGGFIVLFRRLSKIELVSPFAIIIMNTIDHCCDSYARNLGKGLLFLLKKIWQGIVWAGKAAGRGLSKGLSKALEQINRWMNQPEKSEQPEKPEQEDKK